MYENEAQKPFDDHLVTPKHDTQLPKSPIDSSKRKKMLSLRSSNRVSRAEAKIAKQNAVIEKEEKRRDDSPLFYCSTKLCQAKFSTSSGLSKHITSGNHVVFSQKTLQKSVGDYLRKSRLNTLIPATEKVIIDSSFLR